MNSDFYLSKKSTNTWRIKYFYLNGGSKVIQKKIRKYLE